ncbi:hypothetical protein D3C80_948530 [compost metagenome]
MLEEPRTRQAAGPLTDHQRAAQRLTGLRIQHGQMLEGGGERGHRRRRQLQTLDQRAIGQQVSLTTRIVQLVNQRLPVLAADPQDQPGCPSAGAANTLTSARWMAWSGSRSRSPLSIIAR